jgi:23S rRNA (cytidine1920-2'-O)/16S rRNA (cytidine1409-2'-O)-methyltransferase
VTPDFTHQTTHESEGSPDWRARLKEWAEGASLVLVIGVGNELRADDVAGRLVVHALKAPVGRVKAYFAGTVPESATRIVRRLRPSHIIIVDAAIMGLEAGSIRLLDLAEADSLPGTHTAPLSLLRDSLPDVPARWLILGIQPAGLEYLTPPSARVREAARRAALEMANLARQCQPADRARTGSTPEKSPRTALARRMGVADLLVERGYFDDADTAARWVMAGKVYTGSRLLDKPGEILRRDTELRVKGLDCPYVGRGGLKLEAALRTFDLDVKGRVVLDAGASHGGFTDCLLKHGAKYVYAVDVGYGQLAGSLRVDTRVRCLERTNISDLRRDIFGEVPSMATIDLSYLTLDRAVPVIAPLLLPASLIVALVKPMFELGKSTPIVDPKDYTRALESLVHRLTGAQFAVHGIIASPVPGRKGTHEFFILVQAPPASSSRIDIARAIDTAVASAVSPSVPRTEGASSA